MSERTLSDVRTTAQLAFVNCKLSDSVDMALQPKGPEAVVLWNEDSEPAGVVLRSDLLVYAEEGKTFNEYIDKFDVVKACTLNTPLDQCLAQAKVEQEASRARSRRRGRGWCGPPRLGRGRHGRFLRRHRKRSDSLL